MENARDMDAALSKRISEMQAEQRVKLMAQVNSTPKNWLKPLATARRLGRRTVSTIALAAVNAGHETDDMRDARINRGNVQALIAKKMFKGGTGECA